jgi:hypothetical protein
MPTDGGLPIFVASKPSPPPSPEPKSIAPGIGTTVLEEIALEKYWAAVDTVQRRLGLPCPTPTPPLDFDPTFFHYTKAGLQIQPDPPTPTAPAVGPDAAFQSFGDDSQWLALDIFDQQLQQQQQQFQNVFTHTQKYSPFPSPAMAPISPPQVSWSLDEYLNGAPTMGLPASEIPLTASWHQLYTPAPTAFSGYDFTSMVAPPSPASSVSSDEYFAPPPTTEELQHFLQAC